VTLAAPVIGMAVAAAAWLVLGGAAVPSDQLDSLEARLSAGSQSPRPVDDSALLAARLAATPVFALTSGPGAVADVSIGLQGLSITPQRQAALISINGGAPAWLELGASRDGVTLMSVQPTKVTVDTAVGFKDVGLWDAQQGGAGGTASGAPHAGAGGDDGPPPGTRLPPPPASAPGAN
jgi:hypothetical protein